MNLREHIANLAAAEPHKDALLMCSDDGVIIERISRAELLSRVDEAASRLYGLGLQPGDRLALDYANSAELLIVSWAAWMSGIVTVPLDTKRDTPELREYKIKTSGAKQTLAEGELASAPLAKTSPVMPDDSHDALILFTSGTTAYPKGARLTLHNLVTNADSIRAWLDITGSDRFLVVLPLHHINSTTFCLAALLGGASIAIPPKYSNSRFWDTAAHVGATFTSLVPSIVFDQLSRTEEFAAVKDTLKLSRIQLGSAPVVASAALSFIKQFSIPLYQGYGQTETALRVTGMPTDLSPALYEKLLTENSIGTPLDWAEVEIADETGGMLGENEEGELVVKGPAIMQGYIAGEPAFRDGWFLTGDIGSWQTIEGRRFFFLKGRKKEIIIKGGVNISPVAVENALLKISADIDQAYVVGVTDERYGEEVGAVIVWKSGVDAASAMRILQLKLTEGSQHLAPYETPKYLASMSAETLPQTSTGKVQRITLRQTASSLFQPVQRLFKTSSRCFELISPQSPLCDASLALYNQCWQPLTMTRKEYLKYLGDHITLAAVNHDRGIDGQISFSLKDGKLTCVSICSAAFKPKSVPDTNTKPTLEQVRNYLLEGHDPVMNFHQKLGATLVEVIPGGRPLDKSSLGYTMLLRYPPFENSAITEGAPVSHQLIEAARLLGKDTGMEVFALSRPGGLASHLYNKA